MKKFFVAAAAFTALSAQMRRPGANVWMPHDLGCVDTLRKGWLGVIYLSETQSKVARWQLFDYLAVDKALREQLGETPSTNPALQKQ